MDDKNLRILENVKSKLEKAKRKKFTFLLVGQTGRGKSSTINSLMGDNIAPVNEFEPETMEVEFYDAEAHGVKFNIIDTPGLCDDLEEEGKDALYLQKIKIEINEFDCLWFVSRLDENRVTNDEKRAIKLISQAFGKNVWKHAVIVFTFADKVESEKFQIYLEKRTELLVKEIEKYTTKKIAKDIPSVSVSNQNRLLPNGKEWLGELYTKTFTRMSENASLAFFLATADRVKLHKNKPDNSIEEDEVHTPEIIEEDNQNINLSETQSREVKRKIEASLIGEMTLVGVGVGALFGPVGAAVGGAVGAGIGLIAWLWD